MKHTWQTHRTVVARDDAQRRWDRAYQLILEWTPPAFNRNALEVEGVPSLSKEVQHVDPDCSLRPRVEHSPAANPND